MPQVSDSGELNKSSHIALIYVAFPIVVQGRHSRTVISELNTAPMHTLTNASPRHHWSSTHRSGPERIATPYSAEDLSSTSITRRLTSCSMPVLPGAFWTSLYTLQCGSAASRCQFAHCRCCRDILHTCGHSQTMRVCPDQPANIASHLIR